jgi:hypothetical protein
MNSQRMIVLFVDDTNAAEELVHVIDMATKPPWKPAEKFGQPQVRYTEEEIGPWILEKLREAAPHVHIGASVIVP